MAFGRANTRAARTVTGLGLAGLLVAVALPAVAAAPVVPARGSCTISGTPGPDVLTGTPGRDVICGRGGNDRITGGAGDDVVSGGPGDDVIDGAAGDDLLWGSGGDDLLRGGGGADQLDGGDGSDLLRGGAGPDQLRGGSGGDRLEGGRGDDDLRGGPGKDLLDPGTDEQGSTPSPPQPPAPEVPGAPVAVDDTTTTDEDAELDLPASGAGSPAANDTDPDGDPLTVSAVADPVGGTVQVVGATVRFTPEPDRCGAAAGRFDYTVSDGTGRTDTGRVTVDITCLADAPTAEDDTATVAEDSAATAIPVLDNDADVDGDPLAIASVMQPDDGTVVITGGGTGLTYQPDPDHCTTPPGTTADTFTYTLTPGVATATVSVAVTCVDDAPVAVADVATLTEDDPASAIDVLANDTDVDGGDQQVASVTQPAHGTVVITGGGTGLTYEPDDDHCNSQPGGTADSFGYTLAPGADDTTVSVTVTCVEDAPVASDDTATVLEDSAPSAIDVLANDTDVDGGGFTVSSVTQPVNGTVVVTGGGTGLTYAPGPNYCNAPPATTPDTFTYTLAPGADTATVEVTVTCVAETPTAVADSATVLEDAAATAVPVLVNDVDPDGTGVLVTAVTQPAHGTVAITGGGSGLTYAPAANECNDPPGTSPDTFTYTITGGSTATVSMTVTCVEDPSTAVADDVTLDEDEAGTLTVLVNDQIGDTPPSITSVSQPTHGSTTTNGATVGYTPAANHCTTQPGGEPDTFTYTITGGSTATVSVTVTCVNDAPTAAALSVTGVDAAVGNTVLVVDDPSDGAPAGGGPHKTVTRDLLAGATDVETAGSLAVVPGTVTTTAGGSATLEADGDLTYTPPVGCPAVTDTFTYAVTDQDPAGARTAEATVTVQTSDCVWYVSNSAAGSTGTSAAPFDTLAQAQAASLAGHTIYVLGGDGTSLGYDAGIALKAGQRLVGQAVALVVGSSTLAPAVPASRPRLTASSANVVTLAAGNTVTGLLLDPSGAGSAVDGGSGDNGGTLSDLRIVDTGTAATQPALRLASTSGTFTVGDLVVDNTAASGVTSTSVGVELTSAGTVTFTPGATISLTTAGAKALSVTGTTLTGSAFDDITVTGSGSGGVSLVNSPGAVTFGRLALQTTSGATPALNLQTTGAVTVPDSGTSTIDATGGPAIDVATASASSLAFARVTSTTSASRGIRLSGIGGGSFVAHDGTVTGHTGGAFVVEGGDGAVTYDGTIGNGAGRSLEVTGRTGGTVTISKKVTDSADDGGGLLVSGNSGGSTVLPASGTILDTGTGDAIAFTGNGANGGHTLSLTGGSLALTTTSGRGIDASGGTLLVTGTVNRITSGTGRALGLTGTRIGAGDLTFERISTTGAPNGIVLNATGDAGSLVVTGSGGTCTAADTSGCSGGRIAASTGADDSGTAPVGTGIVLTDTKAPSLTRIWVQDAHNYGLRGDRTRGLTLTQSVVNGTIGTSTATPYDDSTVLLTNLSGTASITDTALSGGLEDTLRVTNANTSLDRLTVARVTFGSAGGRPENDAVSLDSSGTGDFRVTVSDSTVQGAGGDMLQYGHSASGAGDLVLSGNSFVNSHPAIASGGGGLTIYQDGAAGGVTMDLTGNTFRGAVGPGVLVAKGPGTARQKGTFANNTIGAAGVPDSGSLSGSALKLQQLGRGSIEWAVTGNQIRGYNNHGIEVLAGGGGSAESGTVNTVVTGNVIGEPGTAVGTATVPKQGVHYNVGTVVGDSFEVCADVRNNDLGSSGAVAIPATGLVTDVVVRQRQATTVHVPGAATSGTVAAEARILAANPTNPPVVRATADLPTNLDGAPCPVLPAP